jgi:hypothetical protein
MWANKPETAREWTEKYGSEIKEKREMNPEFKAHGDEKGGYGKDFSPDY